MKKQLIVVIFLILLLGVGALVYFGQHKQQATAMYYSGTIEGTEANLAFQVSGRVVKVLVDDGQQVEKGQVMAELDRAEFLARRNRAEANLEGCLEKLKQSETVLELQKNTLPAEVEKAEAAVKVLKANFDEMEAGFRVQEVEQVRLSLDAARVTMEEARREKARFDALYKQSTVSENEKDEVALRYEKALKEYERAKQAYKLRREGYRKEVVEAASAKLVEGRAALRQAKGNLKRIEATAREVEVAKAQIEAAKATLELAEIQLKHTHLRAPFRGILTSRNVERGEVVSPGREVLSLSDLSVVDLKIYVDETEIGKVKPGQLAEVKVDTFPNKVYEGQVSFISSEAEFTPKIIQTHKERVKLVYLVKISIPNPDVDLKPGMPADAWLR